MLDLVRLSHGLDVAHGIYGAVRKYMHICRITLYMITCRSGSGGSFCFVWDSGPPPHMQALGAALVRRGRSLAWTSQRWSALIRKLLLIPTWTSSQRQRIARHYKNQVYRTAWQAWVCLVGRILLAGPPRPNEQRSVPRYAVPCHASKEF